jgi:hypothetical protein
VSEIHKSHEHLPQDNHEIDEGLTSERKENEAKANSPEHENRHINVEAVKQNVERQQPTESAELLSKLEPAEEPKPAFPPNKELKKVALANYLSGIRSSLGGSAKLLSKLIHQPQINAISEFSAKTIVRPSAILSAGFFMFVGSALYLYATYHTDAQYNFFVAIFLFLGGFFAGLIFELFYRLFFKRNS